MTARDRVVILVVAALAACGGAWFGLIAPERKEARALADQVAEQRQALDTARQSVASAQQARTRYAQDYATVARLGKAVPVQDDVASLVYQLETAATKRGVDFRAIKLESNGAAAPPAAQAPAPQGAGDGAAAKEGSSGDAGAQAAPQPAVGAAAPAAQSATATLPPGASVGAAGFPTMPFSFTFDGSFFGMQRFFRALDRATVTDGPDLLVRGRLLTIDGFALKAGRNGFPDVEATVKATAYLLPEAEGLTAGATAQGPTTAATTPPAAPAPQTGSSGTPPTPTAAVRP